MILFQYCCIFRKIGKEGVRITKDHGLWIKLGILKRLLGEGGGSLRNNTNHIIYNIRGSTDFTFSQLNIIPNLIGGRGVSWRLATFRIFLIMTPSHNFP